MTRACLISVPAVRVSPLLFDVLCLFFCSFVFLVNYSHQEEKVPRAFIFHFWWLEAFKRLLIPRINAPYVSQTFQKCSSQVLCLHEVITFFEVRFNHRQHGYSSAGAESARPCPRYSIRTQTRDDKTKRRTARRRKKVYGIESLASKQFPGAPGRTLLKQQCASEARRESIEAVKHHSLPQAFKTPSCRRQRQHYGLRRCSCRWRWLPNSTTVAGAVYRSVSVSLSLRLFVSVPVSLSLVLRSLAHSI